MTVKFVFFHKLWIKLFHNLRILYEKAQIFEFNVELLAIAFVGPEIKLSDFSSTYAFCRFD